MNAPHSKDPLQLELNWPAGLSAVPGSIFSREDIYESELEKIFYGPTWHPVAHISELPEPGAFKNFPDRQMTADRQPRPGSQTPPYSAASQPASQRQCYRPVKVSLMKTSFPTRPTRITKPPTCSGGAITGN